MASLKRSVFQWTIFVVLCLFGAHAESHDGAAAFSMDACEKAVSVSAPTAEDVRLRELLLNNPEEWLGSLHVGLGISQQHFEDLKGAVPFDERIFFNFEFSRWFRLQQIGELIIERVGSQWYTHVNINKTVSEGKGLGTFMYLAAAYFLKKYLNIEPISSPTPPDSVPRKAPATALWERFVRWGFAEVIATAPAGKTYRFKLHQLNGTPLERYIESLIRKPSDFDVRFQRFKDGHLKFLQ